MSASKTNEATPVTLCADSVARALSSGFAVVSVLVALIALLK
jgi:hypothetical protein